MTKTKPSILIAGATGAVGRQLVWQAKDRGFRVTALSRNASTLADVVDRVITFDATQGIPELAGHDLVISALGAPVAMSHADRRRFRTVDFGGNLNLLKAARRGGVERFVYISAHVEAGYASTAYVLAHEEFVNALQGSGMSHAVVRPTGIFSAFHDFIPMARRGLMMVLGDGKARTNPVHQADVAQSALDAAMDPGVSELDIGGPDIVTRREIAELAFAAVGKRPRILRLPASLMELGGAIAKITNPRMGELLEFVSRVAVVDCVAPSAGKRKLSDYLNQFAAGTEPTVDPSPRATSQTAGPS
jgi:uncharacterized protein YbjT (DUF2867 family)